MQSIPSKPSISASPRWNEQLNSKPIKYMHDSSDAWKVLSTPGIDPSASVAARNKLLERLCTDGYLLIRSAFPVLASSKPTDLISARFQPPMHSKTVDDVTIPGGTIDVASCEWRVDDKKSKNTW